MDVPLAGGAVAVSTRAAEAGSGAALEAASPAIHNAMARTGTLDATIL
jgi:hypothetical protein